MPAIKFGGTLAKLAKKAAAQQEQIATPAKPLVAAPKVTPVQDPFLVQPESAAEQVDLLISLHAAVKAIEPTAKQYAGVKKSLQLIADESGEAKAEVILTGSGGNKAVYGPKCDQNVIKEGALNLIIGDLKKALVKDGKPDMETIFKLISISQETVKQYLGEEAVAKYYVKTANTGPRSLKAVISG